MKTPSLVTSCCLTAVSNAARFVYLKNKPVLHFSLHNSRIFDLITVLRWMRLTTNVMNVAK